MATLNLDEKRLELQNELEALLGSRNVYYQPPENVKMKYPAIRYNRSNIDSKNANNGVYMRTTRYSLTFISLDPDDPMVGKIMDHFSMIRFDRHYTADGLNHDVFDLYWK